MARRAAEVPEKADRVKKLVAIAVDQAVTLATPVDTGRARANWVVGVTTANRTTTDTPTPVGTAAIQRARQAILAAPARQDLYISNNLPYIVKLNEGSSAQAPSKFVQAAIVTGIKAGLAAAKRQRIGE